MTRILFLDFETNSLDPVTGRVIEIGLSLWDWSKQPSPILSYSVFLNDNFTPLPKEIVELTGITDALLEEFGQSSKANFTWLYEFIKKHKISYICGHNYVSFDALFLQGEFKRHGLDYEAIKHIPVIDTRHDLIFEKEPPSRKLKHLASDAGICPQKFSHRAWADCETTAKLLATQDLEKVVAYSKVPWLMVRALVSFAEKDFAKEQRFYWERLGDAYHPKQWIKKIKADQFEAEVERCSKFQIVKL